MTILTGGGQLTRRPQLLSKDGKLLLICVSNSIRVYSSVTAEHLFTLHGHSDEVTQLCLHPVIATQVYSGSRDGTIRLWDLEDGTEIKLFDVIAEPIESFSIVGTSAFVACHWREFQAGRLLQYDLNRAAAQDSRTKLSKPRQVVTSANGNVVATFDRHTVMAWLPENFATQAPLCMHHTKAITCIALSPDGNKLAAGDVTGRILIWHDVEKMLTQRSVAAAEKAANDTTMHTDHHQIDGAQPKQGNEEDEEEEPPVSTVHWHAHAVGCLAFSSDGIYLFSGGQEAVLVIWESSTGHRGYLPRLGGALTGIIGCPNDPTKYALRQEDNTIRIVNSATMRVEGSIHGVRPLPKGGGFSTSGGDGSVIVPTVVQPGSGYVVLAGPHAMLQWYDVARDAHVDKLQLSQRNIVSLQESDAKAMTGPYGPPQQPAAIAIAFSHDGLSMATAESRPDPSGGGSTQHSLKFWDKSTSGAAQYGTPYRVNTVADQPHRSAVGFGDITSLAFHPSEDVVVTTSDAGEFKMWMRQRLRVPAADISNGNSTSKKATNATKIESTWRCAAVAGYREEALTASTFSQDGSLIAVGSSSGTISLWDVGSISLLRVLSLSSTLGGGPPSSTNNNNDHYQVKQLAFLTDAPYLVATTNHGVAVFDLLNLRCVWSGLIPGVGCIAVDPASTHWALVLPSITSSSSVSSTSTASAHQNGAATAGVVVFKGKSRQPVGGWKLERTSPLQSAIVPPPPHVGTSTSSPSTSSGATTKNSAAAAASLIALAFAIPGTPLYNTFSKASASINNDTAPKQSLASDTMSPLLIFTANREYAIASGSALRLDRDESEIAAAVHAASHAPAFLFGRTVGTSSNNSKQHKLRRDTFAPSGLEAIYGRSALSSLSPGEKQNEQQGGFSSVEYGKGTKGVAALFDVPSHELPPMSELCPKFLEAMIFGDNVDGALGGN